MTTIDLNYSYEQIHLGQDITDANTFDQKYEVKYSSALTAAFDMTGAVKVDLKSTWASRTAETSTIAPTLELEVKGAQTAFKASYQSTQDTTGQYLETGEITTYSYNMSTEFQMTQPYLPEFKLKLDRKRDFQLQTADGTTLGAEFQMKKDIYGVRLEFDLKQERTDQLLPKTPPTRRRTGRAR